MSALKQHLEKRILLNNTQHTGHNRDTLFDLENFENTSCVPQFTNRTTIYDNNRNTFCVIANKRTTLIIRLNIYNYIKVCCNVPCLALMESPWSYSAVSQGTLCKDVMAVCFCGCCSWCQIAREIKIRNGAVCVSHGPSQGGVVTMQPPSTTTTLTSPQVQLVHHPSFIAPSNAYGPLAPAPPGPVAPVYFTAWTAETRPPSALGGGAYALPGYPFQSDFL